jgi:hypothetical protein
VCDLVGIREGCSQHDGQSLLAAWAGKRSADRGAYAEMFRQGGGLRMNALYTGEWKLIYNYSQDRAELYDVRTDRAEQQDVARAHPEVVKQLREQLTTRPLFRQGEVYDRYERAGDSLVLARELEVFRSPDSVQLLLTEFEKDLGKKHVPYLRSLLRRPGLHRDGAHKASELLERLGHEPPPQALDSKAKKRRPKTKKAKRKADESKRKSKKKSRGKKRKRSPASD